MRRLGWLGLVALTLLGDLALAAQQPPLYPGSKRMLGVNINRRMMRMLGGMLISDDRIKHIVAYIESLPGSCQLRVLRLRGEPLPTSLDVRDFYLGWAADNGFRLLFESRERTGNSLNMVCAFHRPGKDGGIFVTQVKGNDALYLWEDGHCPVGPIVSIWMGLPRVEPDMTPPEQLPPWTQRGDLPAIDEDRLEVRLELGSWEIASVAADLAARATPDELEPPLGAVLLAGPELMASVRHMWYLCFTARPDEQDAVAAPWVAWATGLGWPSLAEGEISGARFDLRIHDGEGGGLALVVRRDDKVHVVIFDGGPDLLAIDHVLRRLGSN